MKFCPNCGASLEPTSKFCNNCGAPVQPDVVPTPVPTPVPISTPVSFVVPGSVRAQGIVGMALGIAGMVFAILGLIYTLIGMGLDAMGFAFSIAFSIFSMPLSCVGRALCNKSSESGNFSSVCSIGSKMAMAGIIVSIVMLAFGFISLLIGM